MTSLDQTLQLWVEKAKQLPADSLQRRQCLHKVYVLVMKSGRLWREQVPYYGDAVQQMWEYCCHHLDEYDPAVGSVISWFNFRLNKELRRYRDRTKRQMKRTAFPTFTSEGDLLDPVDTLPARPDISPVLDIVEITLHWVKTDPDGILCATRFRKRVDINAQILFLKRFPAETPWKAIAQELGLNPAEAKDLPKFYNRKCLPLLRNFGLSEGYIE
ncbi:MAG: sigma-70 family RNA polymerase sigma factor [Cyanothece sp. SIO2G6]|nr:sigma-70 family RNA polymerase sigma factor [Cyanothece sp. SIO2G6]